MVSYTGIPEAIDLIMPLGKGALLAKFDIRHSQQRHMLGMQWQGKFYIYLALPFGLRSSFVISIITYLFAILPVSPMPYNFYWRKRFVFQILNIIWMIFS